jgi:transposase
MEVSAMSQSILYHAFGIRGVTYRSADYIGNTVIFNVETTDHHVQCSACNNRDCVFKGKKVRFLRMPPIGRKQALLCMTMHRLQCKSCNSMWWPQLSFVKGTERYTRSFAQTVLDMLRFATIKAVSDFLHVSWYLVKDIHKNKIANTYRHISLANVKYLGVDEFSIRKNHRYMTIFVDLQTGRILHAVEGTSKEVISPFLKRIKKKARHLKAIAMDMSLSYISAVREILPKIPIVFDRYHVMALMNKQIDDLRCELQRTLSDEGKKFLKGSRFLLLRNYDGVLDNDRAKLDKLLQANAPLYEMHTMKEQLRLYWQQDNRKQGGLFLIQWLLDAMNSGVKQLRKMAYTLTDYLDGMLQYYPYKITNGLLEGLNNKIKTMKRQAYGFRDMEYFTLRLYDLHVSRYSFAR